MFSSVLSCFSLCPQESPEPGRSSIYRSLVVNTSKEMMCFSDFPMPAEFPNYMHNSQLLQYFRLYTEHFHLLRYIQFQVIAVLTYQQYLITHLYILSCEVENIKYYVSTCTFLIQTKVRSVTKRPDFSLSGQWDVVTINRDGGEERHIFDAVLVCSGHYTRPATPLSDFPGQWS